MDTSRITAAHQALKDFLNDELIETIEAVRHKPVRGESNDYHVWLPEKYTVDLDITDLMSYVARTSNIFYTMSRLAGIAKACVDMAESEYKEQFKRNLAGSNDKERERNATIAAQDQANVLRTYQGIMRIADKLEEGARVASESARKLLDKVQAMQIATHRGEHGQLKDADFRPY